MVHIVFIDHDGTRREVDAHEGLSVMEVAVANRIPGIDGDCGGACACGTCHVYVDPVWMERFPPPNDLESKMLRMTVEPQANSRLACQIVLDPKLDGVTVTTPISQY